jgi:RND family efflux transporter MFP subunit
MNKKTAIKKIAVKKIAVKKTAVKKSTPEPTHPFFNRRTLVCLLVITAVGVVALFVNASPQTVAVKERQTEQQIAAENSDVILQQVGVMQLTAGQADFAPLRYTATVVARRKSQLSFQASQRVDHLLVDEGDRVEQGQLLAVQDDAAIAALHNAAVARQNQAAAVLAELKKGPRRETIEVARAELNRLQAQGSLARTTLKRQLRLQQTRAGSKQEYDVAAAQSQAAEAAIEAARQSLKELQTGTRQEKIDAQQAAVEVAAATVAQTQTQLDQTRLKAPFAGRISQRYIDEGSLAVLGQPALEIVEVDHLEVRFGVAIKVAQQLQAGQRLPFTAEGQTFSGTVSQIRPTLDRTTRTQEIIVKADAESSQRLVDGQTVRIEFAAPTAPNAPTAQPGMWLPSEALQRQVRGLWSVLVLDRQGESSDGNHPLVARRDVELLATWGDWSRVEGTLEENDSVIVAGSSRVSVGQRVTAQTIQMNPPWKSGCVKLGERSVR